MFSRRIRLALSALALAQFGLLAGLAWARFASFHNRTFDLALYARVAWGLAHGDGWSPILDSPLLGAHLSPVLLPLGLLGRVFGVVPVLLCAQAACVALAGWPLARIGARRLGTPGVVLGALAWLLYPNLGHVATYEFHPGTLAVLPMAWAFDALDRGHRVHLAWAALGVLLCREDLGAFCVLIALVAYFERGDRRTLWLAGACLVYTFVGSWLVAAHAPSHGSLTQHFGVWGGSPLGVVTALFTDPGKVLAHFGQRERLSYLPRILAPLSLFSLRAPRLLLPALPYLALNLISEFPTADEQYSHYLSPAVPAIVASGLVGIAQVRARFVRMLWFVTLGIGFHAMGGLPLARDFDRADFQADAASVAARAVLSSIPAGASVQAPDPLLPHLAERRSVYRGPPPERDTEYAVLDIGHRSRYARRDDLLRTSEERRVRAWLARPHQQLLVYAPPYALFARGRSARSGAAVNPYFRALPPSTFAPLRLTDCLSLESAELAEHRLVLGFRAHSACPADLALYLGPGPVPTRADLLFGGALSPALLLEGDQLRSEHVLRPREAQEFARALYVGLLRQSGARPRPEDPAMVQVPLQVRRQP